VSDDEARSFSLQHIDHRYALSLTEMWRLDLSQEEEESAPNVPPRTCPKLINDPSSVDCKVWSRKRRTATDGCAFLSFLLRLVRLGRIQTFSTALRHGWREKIKLMKWVVLVRDRQNESPASCHLSTLPLVQSVTMVWTLGVLRVVWSLDRGLICTAPL